MNAAGKILAGAGSSNKVYRFKRPPPQERPGRAKAVVDMKSRVVRRRPASALSRAVDSHRGASEACGRSDARRERTDTGDARDSLVRGCPARSKNTKVTLRARQQFPRALQLYRSLGSPGWRPRRSGAEDFSARRLLMYGCGTQLTTVGPSPADAASTFARCLLPSYPASAAGVGEYERLLAPSIDPCRSTRA